MSLTAFLETLGQDVRYAVRTLWSTPTFTLVVLATLAIGVGATTAIFSTVNAVLLRPLPYLHAGDLVSVHTRYVDGRATTGFVSGVELHALNELGNIVERASGFQEEAFNASLLRDGASPVAVSMAAVTGGFFETVGLPMSLGRGFTPAEQLPGGPNGPIVVVASDRAWNSLFARDPQIVGKTIRIAEMGAPVTIVGVASPALALPKNADFWFNARVDPQGQSHFITGIVRLRSGAGIDRLRSAAGVAMQQLAREVPNDGGREYVMQSLVASIVGDLGPVLVIVLGATALLLVLACVNVANLLLARGVARAREMAVRAAIGASRARVVRQLLVESMVLAAAGTLAGLLFAGAAVRTLLVLGASKLPRLETVPIDDRVLLFAVAVLLFSGLVMGVAPAWQMSRADISTLLNAGGRTATSRVATSRVMAGMIVVEVALAIALVAGAGWLVQSFARLRTAAPGFSAEGRLIVDARPTRPFSTAAEAGAWLDELLHHIRLATTHAPVGAAAVFPLRREIQGTTNVEVAGEPSDPAHLRTTHMDTITPDLFKAMGTRIVAGRGFTDDDRGDTQRVAIVNRAFARMFIGGGDPLMASVAWGFPVPNRAAMLRVVGVVDDVRYKSLMEEAEPTVYVPLAQNLSTYLRPVVVIATGAPVSDAAIGAVRAELQRFDPQLIVSFTPASAVLNDAVSRQEFGMTLMLIFGVTALTLAAVGIYGVIAYAATQRRGELATRIALGASRRQVFWLMMSAGQRLALAGLLLGLAVAYAGGRLAASSVYAMRAGDPLVLLAAGAIVAAVTWGATMIPAIRASRLDPVQALRPD